MIVLGLETSCDETAAAVVERGRLVRSSVISSQYELHEEYAGVVPEIASRTHVERLLPVVRHALEEAGIGLGMIDAIAVGNRPGLIGCLLVGTAGAKALAWSLGKPLVGVDHVHAHLYSGLLAREGTTREVSTQVDEDVLPALGLVVSGGHTAMYALDNWLSPRRLGSTIDDAVGEAYDKAATILGLPHPGGPNLDRLARAPGANAHAVELPISRLAPDSLDFSFSGLKTALLYQVRGVPNSRPGTPASAAPLPLTDQRRADLAASFQHAAVAAVLLKIRRAIALMETQGQRPRSLLVGGGVSANSALRAGLVELGQQKRLRVVLPATEFCMDNAAMIAGLAYHFARDGRTDDMSLAASPMSTLR
jgi:N6-L-threonylcarbamoyladenine synthase